MHGRISDETRHVHECICIYLDLINNFDIFKLYIIGDPCGCCIVIMNDIAIVFALHIIIVYYR